MKLTAILAISTFAATAPLVSASNCKTGLDYCGRLLLTIGIDLLLSLAKPPGLVEFSFD